MKIEFVKPESGDWICMLVDGKLVAEDHSMDAESALDALNIEYSSRVIEGDDEEGTKWWDWRNGLDA